MENNKKLFTKTAIKILISVVLIISFSFACALVTINITSSAALGLLASMFAFFLGMIIYILLYPIIFKDFKIYWDKKQEGKTCQEKEVENLLPNK